MAETQEVRDKVVLVGLSSPVLNKEENADEDTMEELSALVETAGGETVGIVLQNRPSPDRWGSCCRTGRPRTPGPSSARARWRRCSSTARTPAPPW